MAYTREHSQAKKKYNIHVNRSKSMSMSLTCKRHLKPPQQQPQKPINTAPRPTVNMSKNLNFITARDC